MKAKTFWLEPGVHEDEAYYYYHDYKNRVGIADWHRGMNTLYDAEGNLLGSDFQPNGHPDKKDLAPLLAKSPDGTLPYLLGESGGQTLAVYPTIEASFLLGGPLEEPVKDSAITKSDTDGTLHVVNKFSFFAAVSGTDLLIKKKSQDGLVRVNRKTYEALLRSQALEPLISTEDSITLVDESIHSAKADAALALDHPHEIRKRHSPLKITINETVMNTSELVFNPTQKPLLKKPPKAVDSTFIRPPQSKTRAMPPSVNRRIIQEKGTSTDCKDALASENVEYQRAFSCDDITFTEQIRTESGKQFHDIVIGQDMGKREIPMFKQARDRLFESKINAAKIQESYNKVVSGRPFHRNVVLNKESVSDLYKASNVASPKVTTQLIELELAMRDNVPSNCDYKETILFELDDDVSIRLYRFLRSDGQSVFLTQPIVHADNSFASILGSEDLMQKIKSKLTENKKIPESLQLSKKSEWIIPQFQPFPESSPYKDKLHAINVHKMEVDLDEEIELSQIKKDYPEYQKALETLALEKEEREQDLEALESINLIDQKDQTLSALLEKHKDSFESYMDTKGESVPEQDIEQLYWLKKYLKDMIISSENSISGVDSLIEGSDDAISEIEENTKKKNKNYVANQDHAIVESTAGLVSFLMGTKSIPETHAVRFKAGKVKSMPAQMCAQMWNERWGTNFHSDVESVLKTTQERDVALSQVEEDKQYLMAIEEKLFPADGLGFSHSKKSPEKNNTVFRAQGQRFLDSEPARMALQSLYTLCQTSERGVLGRDLLSTQGVKIFKEQNGTFHPIHSVDIIGNAASIDEANAKSLVWADPLEGASKQFFENSIAAQSSAIYLKNAFVDQVFEGISGFVADYFPELSKESIYPVSFFNSESEKQSFFIREDNSVTASYAYGIDSIMLGGLGVLVLDKKDNKIKIVEDQEKIKLSKAGRLGLLAYANVDVHFSYDEHQSPQISIEEMALTVPSSLSKTIENYNKDHFEIGAFSKHSDVTLSETLSEEPPHDEVLQAPQQRESLLRHKMDERIGVPKEHQLLDMSGFKTTNNPFAKTTNWHGLTLSDWMPDNVRYLQQHQFYSRSDNFLLTLTECKRYNPPGLPENVWIASPVMLSAEDKLEGATLEEAINLLNREDIKRIMKVRTDDDVRKVIFPTVVREENEMTASPSIMLTEMDIVQERPSAITASMLKGDVAPVIEKLERNFPGVSVTSHQYDYYEQLEMPAHLVEKVMLSQAVGHQNTKKEVHPAQIEAFKKQKGLSYETPSQQRPVFARVSARLQSRAKRFLERLKKPIRWIQRRFQRAKPR